MRKREKSTPRLGIVLHRKEDIERFERFRMKLAKKLGLRKLSRSELVMYLINKVEGMEK